MDPELRAMVKRVVGRVLAERGNAGARPADPITPGVSVSIDPPGGPLRPREPAKARGGRELVTQACLAKTADGGRVELPAGALITAAAEEEAHRRGIRFVAASGDGRGRIDKGVLTLAVGGDHGGFAMKSEVLGWVRECGHRPVDFGTRDENPVDYPDIARAVAEAVARGQCDLGILVDGAGIGSAMAANKVPGVRAANCWDEASANNAREHNYANVLCLGGRMLESELACRIVRKFLGTPEGPERHARRVDKITDIERAYSRRGEPTP